MNKIIGLGMAVLLPCLAAASLPAADNEAAKVERLAQTLRLSPAQKQQVANERRQSKQTLDKLEGKWQALHDRLRGEIRRPNSDAKVIDRLTRELGVVRGEILALKAKSLVYLKSVLNDEQKALLEEPEAGAVAAPAKP